MDEHERGNGESVSVRWPEIGVALLLQAIAVAVMLDSVRVGIGWADDGPRSGYFPFIVGVLLFAAASAVMLAQLRHWRATGEHVFAERSQLRLVMAMAVPVALYVGAIAFTGLYVASTALIAWFMRRHGRYGWLATAAVSIGVPLVCFLVFERWFLVPLPKGPLETALGF